MIFVFSWKKRYGILKEKTRESCLIPADRPGTAGGDTMSVDVLQEKIRKKKNALLVDLTAAPSELPPHLLMQSENPAEAYARFCSELMTGLKELVPAVRFSFGAFALLGSDGMEALQRLLKEAAGQGYYVLLDAPEMHTPAMAQVTADALFGKDSVFPCDGIVLPFYAGSDMLKPFLPYCAEGRKDVFCVVRNANKSASELQDLLTGSRLVHLAAADRVARYSETSIGKSKYSRVALLAAASAAESLRSLRSKYPALFLLVDGLDYPSANMKNASLAFDKLGHGAVVCAGSVVISAWKQAESDGTDYVSAAAESAERLKKNLSRYVSIL